jgi:GNAT superfamily N-acetyltransferase
MSAFQEGRHMETIELTSYTPGALGRVIEFHGWYYAQHWEMGLYFEVRVARELAELMNRFNPATDGAWFARVNGDIVGSIFIDGGDATAQGARLRWFIMHPDFQGRGLGHQLMDAALSFCRARGFKRVYLTTFKGLNTARHLYEKYGFRLSHEENGRELTGNDALIEQVLELVLAPDAAS